MIDIKTQLVATLQTASSWPVYYESLYKPGNTPAITYTEADNADLLNGDTLSYSTIKCEIKIWSLTMADLVAKSIAIDTALKTDGWSRYAAVELIRGNYLIKVLRYVATGYENEV